HRDQNHPQRQVLAHRLGGYLNQVGAVVVRLQSHARQEPARHLVELFELRPASRSAGNESSPLRKRTIPCTLSSSSSHTTLPRASRSSWPSASLRGRLKLTFPSRV